MTEQTGRGPGGAAKSNGRLVMGLALMTGAMLALSFAAVPLYRIFCQVTGYAGTTQRAEGFSAKVLDRVITVRFDANISSELGWEFRPAQNTMDLKIGQSGLAFYKAANRSSKPLTGTATFNVTPEIAGSYFTKVDCFCFTQQTLKAGQQVDMPVSFYIDPAIMDDPDARRLEEITLSYTFFKVDREEDTARVRPAEGTAPEASGRGNGSG